MIADKENQSLHQLSIHATTASQIIVNQTLLSKIPFLPVPALLLASLLIYHTINLVPIEANGVTDSPTSTILKDKEVSMLEDTEITDITIETMHHIEIDHKKIMITNDSMVIIDINELHQNQTDASLRLCKSHRIDNIQCSLRVPSQATGHHKGDMDKLFLLSNLLFGTTCQIHSSLILKDDLEQKSCNSTLLICNKTMSTRTL